MTLDSISVAAGEDIFVMKDASFWPEYLGSCYDSMAHSFTAQSSSRMSFDGNDPVQIVLTDTEEEIESYGFINGEDAFASGLLAIYTDTWAYKTTSGWEVGGSDCTSSYANSVSSCGYPFCPEDDSSVAGAGIELKGIFDFDSSEVDGRAVHLRALRDIPDLSVYALGNANNGDQTKGGPEMSLDAISLNAGDNVLVAREPPANLFSCAGAFEHIIIPSNENRMSWNGDDPVQLFYMDEEVENYGFDSQGNWIIGEQLPYYTDTFVYKSEGGVWSRREEICAACLGRCPYPLCAETIATYLLSIDQTCSTDSDCATDSYYYCRSDGLCRPFGVNICDAFEFGVGDGPCTYDGDCAEGLVCGRDKFVEFHPEFTDAAGANACMEPQPLLECSTSSWSDVDVHCPNCTVSLHNTISAYGSCERYCESQGSSCLGAWSEHTVLEGKYDYVLKGCSWMNQYECTTNMTSFSDVLCQCSDSGTNTNEVIVNPGGCEQKSSCSKAMGLLEVDRGQFPYFYAPEKSDIMIQDDQIRTVVINSHGANRNGAYYYCDGLRAVGDYYGDDVYVLLPQFFQAKDGFREYISFASNNQWIKGREASAPEISSYEIYDRFYGQIIDSFPNLQQIIHIGFSGGAQFTQHWIFASVGIDPETVPRMHFVIGNPSSWLYMSEDRPDSANNGTCGGYCNAARIQEYQYTFSPVDSDDCSSYNTWKFGTETDNTTYLSQWDDLSNAVERYQRFDITYLAGELDNYNEQMHIDYCGAADEDRGDPAMSCGDAAQGVCRYERAYAHVQSLKNVFPGLDPPFVTVPGVGHSACHVFMHDNAQAVISSLLSNVVSCDDTTDCNGNGVSSAVAGDDPSFSCTCECTRGFYGDTCDNAIDTDNCICGDFTITKGRFL